MSLTTLRIANTLGFIAVLVLNYLANTLPINGITTGELSDLYPNYFVPAGFTFAIWGIIYLALLGFVIYQWVSENAEDAVRRIGLWFVISCLANASWILAWHYQWVSLSLLIMLMILGSLILVYLRLGTGQQSVPSQGTRWLVRVPFSIYLGWITVATIANITTLLVNIGWSGGPLSEPVWAAIVIGAAVIIGLIVLFRRADIFYTAVLLWAFYGIYSKRAGLDDLPTSISIALIAGSILLLIGVVVQFNNWRKLGQVT